MRKAVFAVCALICVAANAGAQTGTGIVDFVMKIQHATVSKFFLESAILCPHAILTRRSLTS